MDLALLFGLPGSLNDISVLQRSHLFARHASGDPRAWNFTLNDHEYDIGYYLADGIYCSIMVNICEDYPKSKR